MQLKQYDQTMLETWGTGRLGALYLSSFSISREEPQELPQLETIAEILFRRPFDERKGIYLHIQNELAGSIRAEDYERAALMRDMKEHYHRYVF
ncbi:MAG: hypothetical protein KJ709_09690 [Nanoarchaeota archaeon]|nr:hypothetical protein [Nanoarchaeota archaeon]